MLAQLATGWQATAPLGQRRLQRRGGRIHLAAQALRKIPYVKRFARFVPSYQRQAFKDIDRKPSPFRPSPLQWSDQPRIEEMAALVSRLEHDGRVRQVRDAEYLRWRLSNPMHSRRYIYWVEEDDLDGYLILEAPRHSLSMLNILDAEASRPDILKQMLGWLTRVSRRSNITTFARCLPCGMEQQINDLGFQERIGKGGFGANLPCIMVRPVNESAPNCILAGVDLRDLDNWDMRRLYNM